MRSAHRHHMGTRLGVGPGAFIADARPAKQMTTPQLLRYLLGGWILIGSAVESGSVGEHTRAVAGVCAGGVYGSDGASVWRVGVRRVFADSWLAKQMTIPQLLTSCLNYVWLVGMLHAALVPPAKPSYQQDCGVHCRRPLRLVKSTITLSTDFMGSRPHPPDPPCPASCPPFPKSCIQVPPATAAVPCPATMPAVGCPGDDVWWAGCAAAQPALHAQPRAIVPVL